MSSYFKTFLFCTLCLLAAYIIVSPAGLGIRDEATYLSMAKSLSHGRTDPEALGLPWNLAPEKGWHGHYAPLWPMVLTCLEKIQTVFSDDEVVPWRGVALVCHVLSVFLLALVLIKRQLSPFYSLLLLFYPGAVFYAYGAMAESLALLFCCLAIYFYSFALPLAAGLCLGAIVLTKYGAVFWVLPLLLVLLWQSDLKSRVCLMLGSVLAVLFLICLNLAVNQPFLFPFLGGVSHPAAWGWHYALDHAPFYLLLLFCVWPGMGWALIKRGGLFCIPVLCWFVHASLWFHVDALDQWGVNLVVGARTLVPLLPLLILPYAQFLSEKKPKLHPGFCVLPLSACVALWFLYDQHYLKPIESIRQQIARFDGQTIAYDRPLVRYLVGCDLSKPAIPSDFPESREATVWLHYRFPERDNQVGTSTWGDRLDQKAPAVHGQAWRPLLKAYDDQIMIRLRDQTRFKKP